MIRHKVLSRHLPQAALAFLMLVGLFASGMRTVAAGLGPPSGLIYAHDHLFRTIGTPTELPPSGVFDTIYTLGDGLASVAEVAPGDQAFNGGRWEVRPIAWTGMSPTQFTNAEQIVAAAQEGRIQIGEVVRCFECPLIPAN
jgi:hypothetical protein